MSDLGVLNSQKVLGLQETQCLYPSLIEHCMLLGLSRASHVMVAGVKCILPLYHLPLIHETGQKYIQYMTNRR